MLNRKIYNSIGFILLLVVFLLSLLLPTRLFAYMPDNSPDKHTIDLEIDFVNRRINGTDTITFAGDSFANRLYLVMSKDVLIESVVFKDHLEPLLFRIRELSLNNRPTGLAELIIDLNGKLAPVRISFVVNVSPIEAARQRIERGVSFSGISVMGIEGAFLPASAYWFPRRSDNIALYDITLSLPSGYEAVMEGELAEIKDERRLSPSFRYVNTTPTDGVNLVAGRYAKREERYKGIMISTYFYNDDPELARTYIDKTKQYLDIYDGLLPKYPYKKFVVVENFLPTGFGMPSFTLLGTAVIRLPFIPDTSLGHEFVHNWWGNGVLIDSSFGNWSEALTSYTADHLFRERGLAGEAASYRLKALTNYANYAGESKRTVSSFAFGSSPEARALGYSKAMMVFHMLRNLVGDELFYESIGRFYVDNAFTRATWQDIRTAFEAVTSKKLGWFFDQWLLRAGGPELAIEDVRFSVAPTVTSYGEPVYKLEFVVRQEPPAYKLIIPILIETEGGGELSYALELNGETGVVKVDLKKKPMAIEIDPESDIFRVLSERETAPSLAALLGDKNTLLVVPSEPESREKYLPAVKRIQNDYGLGVIDDIAVLKGDAGRAPLFIFGGRNENALF